MGRRDTVGRGEGVREGARREGWRGCGHRKEIGEEEREPSWVGS